MFLPTILSGRKNAITVFLSDTDEQTEKDFRCVVCGKICFQYTSSVELIIPGHQGLIKPPIIIQCNRTNPITFPGGYTKEVKCKTKYYVFG